MNMPCIRRKTAFGKLMLAFFLFAFVIQPADPLRASGSVLLAPPEAASSQSDKVSGKRQAQSYLKMAELYVEWPTGASSPLFKQRAKTRRYHKPKWKKPASVRRKAAKTKRVRGRLRKKVKKVRKSRKLHSVRQRKQARSVRRRGNRNRRVYPASRSIRKHRKKQPAMPRNLAARTPEKLLKTGPVETKNESVKAGPAMNGQMSGMNHQPAVKVVTADSFRYPNFMTNAAKRGERVFEENCTACHGKNALGTESGPPLLHDYYRPGHHADLKLYAAPRFGVDQHHWTFGDMPPIEGIREDDVHDLIVYIRTLQRSNGIF